LLPECVLLDIQVDVAVRQIHHLSFVPERAARKAASELAGALDASGALQGRRQEPHVVDPRERIAITEPAKECPTRTIGR